MEWQKNLYHHEETPPEGAWSQITTQLDEQPWELRKNLYDEEVIPPPANWNMITSQLETGTSYQESAKVIPFYRRKAGVAAAAMLGAVILVSAYYFLAKKDLIKPTDIAASVIDSPKKPAASKPSSNDAAVAAPSVSEKQPEEKQRSNNLPQREEQLADVQPQEHTKRSYTGSPFAIQSVDRYPKSAYYSYNINALNRCINSKNRRVPAFQKSINPPYIILQNEDGQMVRVSSKFKDVIYYLPQSDANFDDSELPVSEMDYWKRVFSDWKKKADNSPFIPDGGAFFDIVGFIKMLQENK